MKKFFAVILFCFSAITFVFAKGTAGLSFDVGAQYLNHQLHNFGKDNKNNGNDFNYHSIAFKNMGGFNLGMNYEIAKNWSVFLNTAFSFNSTFVNDTVLGFGYTFGLDKGFRLFLGGGLAFGGSEFSKTYYNTTTKTSYVNVGGAVQLVASYMFTRMFGIYFGVSDNLYAVVKGTRKIGSTTTDIQTDYLPDMNKSMSAKVGLRIAL